MGIIYLHGMEFALREADGVCRQADGRAFGTHGRDRSDCSHCSFYPCVQKKWAEVKQIYKVTLTEQGEHAVYRALFDTGNL